MDLLELREKIAQWEPELVKTLPLLSPSLVEEYITISSTSTASSITTTTTTTTSFSSSPKTIKVTRPLHPPPNANANAPLILLFHGGGFCTGSIEQLTRPARDFAAAFSAVVLTASYAFTPEHPFPASVEDAYETLLWVARNAEQRWGVDLKREGSAFVVGGFSAGGNIAAVLAPLSVVRGELPEGVKVTGSFIVIPPLLVKEIVPAEYEALWTSREENKDGGGGGSSTEALTSTLLDAITTALNPDVHSPLFSPFNHANATATPEGEDVLARLPRTYLQVGERDILRDDGVVYERFLKARGVQVKLDVNPGLGHVAYTIFMHCGGEVEEGMRERTVEGMRWLLGL